MIRDYLHELMQYSRSTVFFALFLSIIAGITQGLSLVMLIPLLQTLGLNAGGGTDASGETGTGGITAVVSDVFSSIGLELNLYTILAAYFVVVAVLAAINRHQTVLNSTLQQGFTLHLRNRLYRALTYAQWLFTVQRKSSDITHGMTSDIGQVGGGALQFMQLISSAALMVFHVAAAFLLSIPLTAVTLVFGAFMMLMLKGLNQKAYDAGKSSRRWRKRMMGGIMEHLSAMKVAKSFGMEDEHISRFESAGQGIRKEILGFVSVRALTRMFYEIGGGAAMCLYLIAAVKVFRVPLPTLLVLVFIFTRLMPRFSAMMQSYQQIKNMIPAYDAVRKFYREASDAKEFGDEREAHSSWLIAHRKNEKKDSSRLIEKKKEKQKGTGRKIYREKVQKGTGRKIHREKVQKGTGRKDGKEDDRENGKIEIFQLETGISLQDVRFCYPGEGNTDALRDITCLIPARGITAVVGPSGAGKSTLADLLLGLLKPDRGEIKVDELEISNQNIQQWRNSIGYVPQDTVLFHDSVRANLIWAKPEAGEPELWNGLKMAAAESFVKNLPHGLETVIGDRGVRLSGGERQRISLARALLREPRFLLLDEATSALDSQNERHIQNAIEALQGNLTIMIIAHRLSTIRNADHIMVLDKGKLIEQGSWESLSNIEGGTFRRMVNENSLA